MARTWICNGCGYATEWSYDQVATQGNPTCPDENCEDFGEEMELQPES